MAKRKTSTDTTDTTPPELAGDDARLAWTRYTAALTELGTINAVDRAALITLCQVTALKEDASRHLNANGPIIKLPNGYPGPNPYLKVFLEAAKLEKGLQIEFGLTPKSRPKGKAADEQADTRELDA